MPNDESMEVRIALLESMVDDLLYKAIELRRDNVAPSDFVNFRREVDSIHSDVANLRGEAGSHFLRLEDRIIRLGA